MHTFTFDGKNSYADYGLTVESIDIGSPVRRQTEVTIPLRSSVIDIDEVASYTTYDDRTITVKVWCRLETPEQLYTLANTLTRAFLVGVGRKSFVDDDDPTSTYMAICTQISYSDSTRKHMRCTLTFKANPYRIVGGKDVL